ncbi:hypothetical protein QAD02_008078 [Eretmocerus hayati]|uniref:Uncharacterized protein n=1 Tax=Eretmocerus hayati TaxID=131215 RepID=A0ACC2N6U7_9HYME|nr:hypothetical protein QAD02_008078 [Eretmocerus hayati]
MASDSDAPDPEIDPVRVEFCEDRHRKLVPMYDVYECETSASHIIPKHWTDFIKDHRYQVKWFYCGDQGSRCSKSHQHPFRLDSAVIKYLGVTEPTVEMQTNPQHRSSTTATSTEVPRKMKPVEIVKKGLRAKKRARKRAAQKRAHEELATAMSLIPNKVAYSFKDDSDSDESKLDEHSRTDELSSGSESDFPPSSRITKVSSRSALALVPRVRPCSVQLETLTMRSSTPSVNVDYHADLPTGASSTRFLDDQSFKAGSSGVQMNAGLTLPSNSQLSRTIPAVDRNCSDQSENGEKSATEELEDIRRRAAEAQAYLISLDEAQELMKRRRRREEAENRRTQRETKDRSRREEEEYRRRQEEEMDRRNREEEARRRQEEEMDRINREEEVRRRQEEEMNRRNREEEVRRRQREEMDRRRRDEEEDRRGQGEAGDRRRQ